MDGLTLTPFPFSIYRHASFLHLTLLLHIHESSHPIFIQPNSYISHLSPLLLSGAQSRLRSHCLRCILNTEPSCPSSASNIIKPFITYCCSGLTSLSLLSVAVSPLLLPNQTCLQARRDILGTATPLLTQRTVSTRYPPPVSPFSITPTDTT